MLRRLIVSFLCVTFFGCGQNAEKSSAPPPADAHVRVLADTYLAAWFDRFPEQLTEFGVPGHRQDKLTDNSLEAWKSWQDREDAWLAEAKQIDAAMISAPPLRATYALVREGLEGSIALRTCRNEVWTVSQFVNAWQVQYGYLVTIQPVGADEARQDALARWGSLPKFIDTEITNLREGIKQGYTAPKSNVRIVIDQMNTLISGPISASPFDSPSVRWSKNRSIPRSRNIVTSCNTTTYPPRANRSRSRPFRMARRATTPPCVTTVRCRFPPKKFTRQDCAWSTRSPRK